MSPDIDLGKPAPPNPLQMSQSRCVIIHRGEESEFYGALPVWCAAGRSLVHPRPTGRSANSAKTRWPRCTRGQRGSRCDELERGVRPSSLLTCHQLPMRNWYAADISSRPPAEAGGTPVELRSPTALLASAFETPLRPDTVHRTDPGTAILTMNHGICTTETLACKEFALNAPRCS